MTGKSAGREKEQYTARIWVKDNVQGWHYIGERRLFEYAITAAMKSAIEQNDLHDYEDYKVQIRETDQYRPKIRGWR